MRAAIFFGVLPRLVLAAQAQEAGGRYADRQFGYSLQVPAGWERKTDMPRPYVAFLGPVTDGYQTNFSIYTEPAAHRSLAQFVKVAGSGIAHTKTMRFQSSRRTVLGGAPAVTIQTVVKVPNSPPSAVRQVLAVHKGRGYTLTFTARPTDLKGMTPVFDKVISSFRWR